ncbi:MAG: type II toxin-antitoxin system PemK/MazF family toxin [Gemmataceae bacterium]
MARSAPYSPARGDLVWLDFDPQVGHEQSGRRPALVLSGTGYNAQTGLMIVCPITGRAKGYSSEVPIPAGLPITGVVLCDQVKCLDWAGRRAVYIGPAPPGLVVAVLSGVLLAMS